VHGPAVTCFRRDRLLFHAERRGTPGTRPRVPVFTPSPWGFPQNVAEGHLGGTETRARADRKLLIRAMISIRTRNRVSLSLSLSLVQLHAFAFVRFSCGRSDPAFLAFLPSFLCPSRRRELEQRRPLRPLRPAHVTRVNPYPGMRDPYSTETRK